jgi:hypothetical protein
MPDPVQRARISGCDCDWVDAGVEKNLTRLEIPQEIDAEK